MKLVKQEVLFISSDSAKTCTLLKDSLRKDCWFGVILIRVLENSVKVPRRALCTLWWPNLANNFKSSENSINYSKTTSDYSC